MTISMMDVVFLDGDPSFLVIAAFVMISFVKHSSQLQEQWTDLAPDLKSEIENGLFNKHTPNQSAQRMFSAILRETVTEDVNPKDANTLETLGHLFGTLIFSRPDLRRSWTQLKNIHARTSQNSQGTSSIRDGYLTARQSPDATVAEVNTLWTTPTLMTDPVAAIPSKISPAEVTLEFGIWINLLYLASQNFDSSQNPYIMSVSQEFAHALKDSSYIDSRTKLQMMSGDINEIKLVHGRLLDAMISTPLLDESPKILQVLPSNNIYAQMGKLREKTTLLKASAFAELMQPWMSLPMGLQLVPSWGRLKSSLNNVSPISFFDSFKDQIASAPNQIADDVYWQNLRERLWAQWSLGGKQSATHPLAFVHQVVIIQFILRRLMPENDHRDFAITLMDRIRRVTDDSDFDLAPIMRAAIDRFERATYSNPLVLIHTDPRIKGLFGHVLDNYADDKSRKRDSNYGDVDILTDRARLDAIKKNGLAEFAKDLVSAKTIQQRSQSLNLLRDARNKNLMAKKFR